ncbi:MAG: OmpA family protein [Alphaproteobacteria bacterium]
MLPKSRFLLAAVVAMMPAVAMAGSSGVYVGAAGGVDFLNDAKLSGNGVNTKSSYDMGYVGLGTLGYKYDKGFRVEFEGGYRSNAVDKLANSTAGVNGRVHTSSIMLNGLYDIDTGTILTPYVGIGVGGAKVDFRGVNPVNNSTINKSDHLFAYQGILGTSLKVTDAVSLFTDYRYLGTPDPGLRTGSGVAIDGEYGSHNVVLGVRYLFGSAPPPPPPAAAPAPAPSPVVRAMEPPAPEPVARNYLVFFDFDRAVLTPEARKIIAAAATNVGKVHSTQIDVTGHTDLSGAAKYNMTLSQKRADAVKAELVRLGVSARDIAITAKGKSTPMVSTADGAREPQNRRVEIVLK